MSEFSQKGTAPSNTLKSETNNVDTITNLPHKLKITRPKRIHSASFSHSGPDFELPNEFLSDAVALPATMMRVNLNGSRLNCSKNSRKSRNGRKVPNKRGGKNSENHVDVLDEVEIDHDDPDYDSDENDSIIIETIKPSSSDEEIERTFQCLLREMYVHGNPREVLQSVQELNLSPHQRRSITYLAITFALQQKKTQCELTSELLSEFCGPVLSQAHIQQGIQMVLYELADLIIDVPNAVEQVGRFIARALVDDILPPKFIEYQKSALSKIQGSDCDPASLNIADSCFLSGSPPVSASIGVPIPKQHGLRNLSGSDQIPLVGSAETHKSSGYVSETSLTPVQPELALSALKRADTLLNLSRAFARYDNIWGIPAGPRATSALGTQIRRLLSQYFESGDVDEAHATLADFDCPHFHHELVFQCIIKYIEDSSDKAYELAVNLLRELCNSAEVTADQMNLGVRRVCAELPDLKLDVPAAYQLMDRFIKTATNGHFLSRRVANELTSNRARKRIVSETQASYMAGLVSGGMF